MPGFSRNPDTQAMQNIVDEARASKQRSTRRARLPAVGSDRTLRQKRRQDPVQVKLAQMGIRPKDFARARAARGQV